MIPPVAAKLTRDPAGAVRGTVILVHAGGWAGHDAHAQQILFDQPGDVFLERGWRVVSVDYDEGTAGLQDVLSAVGDELARGTSTGPLCLYGESAGAQLAIVAAARVRSVDCVIGLGAPTDLALYESQGATSDNAQVRLVATRMGTFFGTTPEALGPWNPVALAPSMRADVLLLDEGDDGVVSAENAARFAAARPTTQTVVLESGDPNDPSTKFVHGTVSAAGRAAYDAADRRVRRPSRRRQRRRAGRRPHGLRAREPHAVGGLAGLAADDARLPRAPRRRGAPWVRFRAGGARRSACAGRSTPRASGRACGAPRPAGARSRPSPRAARASSSRTAIAPASRCAAPPTRRPRFVRRRRELGSGLIRYR